MSKGTLPNRETHRSGPEENQRRQPPSQLRDAAELAWWEQFAAVEDRYCWVQTPVVQRFLRGAYLRRIVKAGRQGRVLEVGCGSGWLCLLLGRLGAASVEGIDPSAAQIARAQAAVREAGLSGAVRFHRAMLPAVDGETQRAERYDVLVLHAVLHHLSDAEIHQLLSTFVHQLAQPDARVFVVEPVAYRDPSTCRTGLDRLVDRLILLPRAGRRLGLRRVTSAEEALTSQIDRRGDSPKEAPFDPGELEQLVAPYLNIERTLPVLNFSYLGAKNALLMQLSHPVRSQLLFWPYLWLLRTLERVVLRLPRGATWLPLFMLFECRVRPVDARVPYAR